MKKILLVGELNEIMRSLNECLVQDFQVQICAEESENIKGMLKIIRPQLLIINLVGAENLDEAIFDWLQEKYPKLPVLLIMVWEERAKYKELYSEKEQFHEMFRPVAKSDLVEKCNELLGVKNVKKINSGSGMRIRRKLLLVDDSPLQLRNMKAILEKKYEVFLATSGEMALKMIPQKQPDLILLDYDMPGMSGKKTFELIKEDNDMADIPVVFLTAVAERDRIYEVLPSRPAGYILKPAERDRLLETIEDVLRG